MQSAVSQWVAIGGQDIFCATVLAVCTCNAQIML